MDFVNIAKSAKEASLKAADLAEDIKNKALLKMADALERAKEDIFKANKADLAEAEKLVDVG